MIRPPYAALQTHYPDRQSVSSDELYRWIGYPEYASDPRWQNTCAVRVSLGLLGAGLDISPGHLTVKAGKWKGRRIEQGQSRLSDFLLRAWGEPEKIQGAIARDQIGQRRGVISFFEIWGPFEQQGHIDIAAPDQWGRLMCEGSCYWTAVQAWFWEL